MKEESRVAKLLVAVWELRDTATAVVLRALEKRTVLQLEFTNDGIPAAGLQLISCLEVACGAGCGTIEGETDQSGRVLLKEYYPEEIYLILTGHSNQVYWQGPVPEPAKTGLDKGGYFKMPDSAPCHSTMECLTMRQGSGNFLPVSRLLQDLDSYGC